MTGMSGFNTAVSGLSAAQRAIEVTSQNIANVNTPGYSRQQVHLSSRGATSAANFHTGSNLAILGGVQIDAVVRVRDTFLETARVNAGATKAALDIRASTLNGVEGLLNEPGDDGLQAVLDDFYASWHELAASPGTNQAAAGGQVLAAANSLVTQMSFVASGVIERWNNAQSELRVSVSELNQATADLATLNQQIREGTAADRPINELLDRRDSLVRTLADLAGGRAVIAKDSTATVLINNITVVSGDRSMPITLGGGNSLTDAPTDPPKLMMGDVAVPVSGGKMAGLLAALGSDMPNVAAQLDGVAIALRDAVNSLHSTGYTLTGETAVEFFNGTGAIDMAVSVTSTDQLAVASEPGVVDGTNAEKIADLALDDKAAEVLDGEPGPSVLLRAMAADLGTKLQGLNRAVEVQDSVFATADAASNSDAGVSIDEEMTSLLQYQRSYQASARVISAVDELLDTLINRTAV
jgi:flagellar hook-associated protein 1 FlgK